MRGCLNQSVNVCTHSSPSDINGPGAWEGKPNPNPEMMHKSRQIKATLNPVRFPCETITWQMCTSTQNPGRWNTKHNGDEEPHNGPPVTTPPTFLHRADLGRDLGELPHPASGRGCCGGRLRGPSLGVAPRGTTERGGGGGGGGGQGVLEEWRW